MRPVSRLSGAWKARAGLPVLAGLFAALTVIAVQLGDPAGTAQRQREAGFDTLLAAAGIAVPLADVVVVDIDRASLARHGPWPWPRDKVAELIEAIATGAPKALAIDIVFGERPEDDQARLATARLAVALAKVPTVLGMALDTDSGDAVLPAPPPILVSTDPVPGLDMALPSAAGLVSPASVLARAARGVGVLSLPTEDGAPVRDALVLVDASGSIWTSLAVEAVRIAYGESPVYWEAGRRNMIVAGRHLAAPERGRMRLLPDRTGRWQTRTISAVTLLDDPGAAALLANKLVFLGSGAPEAGGLRPTPLEPFAPSVQLHADAATQLLGGVQPLRRKAYVWPEAAASLGLAAAAMAAALLLAPAKGMAILIFACALAIASAVLVHATSGLLADASFPVLGATSAFFATSLTRLAGERRARQAIERRFAMHLAPEIVARIIADPAALKLSGERRVVTALFTDIEGFTAMTEGADPEDLVFLLDRYIELVCAAVRAHGGMVDKVVGDAVHAYFNAPVDLPRHADRALDAATNIISLTQKLCADPLAARLGLGRTRIGIETGSVIVGDIGGTTKLDYTAHGPAVNLAARLEAFCKGRTEAIAIGPGTVALLSPDRKLRIAGTLRASAASPEITVMTPDT